MLPVFVFVFVFVFVVLWLLLLLLLLLLLEVELCLHAYLLLGLLKEDFFLVLSMEKFSILCCIFQLFNLCWAGLVERYCVNLFFSWNIFVSPSMVTESFPGYHSLGWHLCSLSVCLTSAKDLLTFIVSGKNTGVILIGLILYINWLFFLLL